jgi:hypothetical protein
LLTGEIVRRILLSMANRGLLWPATGCPFALRVPYGLPSWVVSKIDDSGTPLETARVELAELGLLVNGSVGLSRVSIGNPNPVNPKPNVGTCSTFFHARSIPTESPVLSLPRANWPLSYLCAAVSGDGQLGCRRQVRLIAGHDQQLLHARIMKRSCLQNMINI